MSLWGHALGGTRENISGNIRAICGGSSFPGGTLTDINLHCIGWGGTGNLRVWVYSDTDSDPSGASLVYDSGNLSLTVGQLPASWATRSFVTDFGQTVSASIPAGPVYIVVGALDHSFGLGNSGQGTDLDYLSARLQVVNSLVSQTDTIDNPDPFPSYSSEGQAEQIMVQLVYSTASGNLLLFNSNQGGF